MATTADASLPTLTESVDSWKGSSLLSVTQITPAGLQLLFDVSQGMRQIVRTQGGDDRLQHRLLGTVFYEASTRTSCSFQAAVMRLGGKFIHVDGQGNSSANKKGESLEDTIRCLECYTDATVLRHPVHGSVGRVIQMATKPVLNAGDGVGEHPTQALLDVFTIRDELKITNNDKPKLTVVLLGDLKHGRTVHSLAKLLAQSQMTAQLTLQYCSPPGLEMPQTVQDFVAKYDNVTQQYVTNLAEVVATADVLYVTRIQRERFASDDAYEQVKGSYVVNNEIMSQAKSSMIVLHPLPRVDEIATEVDADPRAAYFRQMENGMFVRMALLALVLGVAQK
ncbi:Aspartate carbamoyltransferase [Seminavis robusta]|uniref:aspartate carbamoyltransferase n=1 Tax=Seminavis robusta TaxID=568900 RepID=A0A9N8HES3_9STRA|nr:Aspartate carbamoyltransferase [Seminavis robusta]|eukprot:Sro487_g152950.1 Aspartate carbamoyltransferase (337) ;mRNA; f:55586-56596